MTIVSSPTQLSLPVCRRARFSSVQTQNVFTSKTSHFKKRDSSARSSINAANPFREAIIHFPTHSPNSPHVEPRVPNTCCSSPSQTKQSPLSSLPRHAFHRRTAANFSGNVLRRLLLPLSDGTHRRVRFRSDRLR